jgi:hypothetical protein
MANSQLQSIRRLVIVTATTWVFPLVPPSADYALAATEPITEHQIENRRSLLELICHRNAGRGEIVEALTADRRAIEIGQSRGFHVSDNDVNET